MEANFIGEVDDIYKCIVCHLVLKDPVFIIECGHRLCKHCFESLRTYALQHNKQLLCPHDRNEIDAEKVVVDKGVARTIMNLQVHCNNYSEGCTWTGELRQLESHADKHCSVTSLKKFMDNMEKRLKEKDQEMKEMQERMTSKDDQVKLLEGTIKQVVDNLEEKDQKMKELQERMTSKDDLKILVDAIKQVVDKLEDKAQEMKELREWLALKDDQVKVLRVTIKQVVEKLEDKDQEMKELRERIALKDDQVKVLEDTIKQVVDKLEDKDQEMKELRERIALKDDQVKILEDTIKQVVDKPEDKAQEMKELRERLAWKDDQVKILEDTIKQVVDKLEDKTQEMKELQDRMASKDDLVKVMELENAIKQVMDKLNCETDGQMLIQQCLRTVEEQIQEKNEEMACLKYDLSGLRVEFIRNCKGKDLFSTTPAVKKRKIRSSQKDRGKENSVTCDVIDMGDSGMCSEAEQEEELDNFLRLEKEVKELDKKISRIELKNILVSNDMLHLNHTNMNRDNGNCGSCSKSCPSNCTHCEGMKVLVERVMNVHAHIPNKHTLFVWKVKNFAYHENLKQPVNSPAFYSSLSGHCLDVCLNWKESTKFGVYIRSRSGATQPDNLFAMNVTFSSTDAKGKQHKFIIKKQKLIDNADRIAISPGSLVSKGCGKYPYLEYPGLKDFIIDDTLTITCELTNE